MIAYLTDARRGELFALVESADGATLRPETAISRDELSRLVASFGPVTEPQGTADTSVWHLIESADCE